VIFLKKRWRQILPLSKSSSNNLPMFTLVPPWLNPNALAPGVNRYRIICHGLSTAMSLSHAIVNSAAKTWSKSVKISLSNWMLNPPSYSFIVIFAPIRLPSL
jgi:hypothetical protein